jgi:hypothetical protein
MSVEVAQPLQRHLRIKVSFSRRATIISSAGLLFVACLLVAAAALLLLLLLRISPTHQITR